MAEAGNLGLGWHGAEGAGLAGKRDVALARVGAREHTRQGPESVDGQWWWWKGSCGAYRRAGVRWW